MNEPDIYNTICKSRELSVILTGIGGKSSLPLLNPAFRPYITPGDAAKTNQCSGSIYGYVLDLDGQIADLELNRKLVSVPLENILQVPHRIAAAYGRHKADIIAKVIKNGFINELITDTDTAFTLLSQETGA